MHIQQLYTNCLAQAAYYIESNGEAAIIDPMRDIDIYIELLEKRGVKLKYILETHFHADFVSGHIDLSQLTGATIVFGPGAAPNYKAYIAQDNEILKVGDCQIKVLHTPGHTLESVCFLLIDDENKPHSLFSGDTLFIGDVGRPDLLSGNLSADVLGSMLYMSLHDKIMPLNDDIVLYPGHGAGSACGRSMNSDTVSTIGAQKKHNYALQPQSREDFIEAVTKDQPLPPSYFFKDAVINKTGYKPLSEVLHRELIKISTEDLLKYTKDSVTILDVRKADEFAELHIKNAINIGLSGSYAVWAGTLIPIDDKLVIICNKNDEKDAIVRLGRVGYENILGYWNEPITKLKDTTIQLSSIESIEANVIPLYIQNKKALVIDIRTPSEFEKNKFQGAINIPLNQFPNFINTLNKSDVILLYCAGGYRSMIAASLLQKEGFTNIVNVNGGMSKIELLLRELVEYVF
jgi:hydroxyacylglutathione hydrolase